MDRGSSCTDKKEKKIYGSSDGIGCKVRYVEELPNI
jgi:hypothetical protein